MDEIIKELKNKCVDIENEYHETKDEICKDVKCAYRDTYCSISKDKKEYDYFNFPIEDGSFFSVKFKKLSEEAITFLLENWDEADCTYPKEDSNEPQKSFRFQGSKFGLEFIFPQM